MVKPFLALMPNEQPPTPQEKASAIAELFEMARRREIPRHRALLPHEPDALNERHLQAIMMRCMGMRQKDIAQSLQYTDGTVSIVLNHPDATYIIDRLQSFSGTDVVDIDARLRRLSPKAIDAIEEVFDEDELDPKIMSARVQKARLGFALLEHTGHGPKKKVEHKHEHALRIDNGAASLLTRALRESGQIEDAEYTLLNEGAPGNGVEGSGPPTALPSGAEAPPLGASQEFPLDRSVN